MDVLKEEHTHNSPHNPDSCIACIVERIKEAKERGKTPDMHDLFQLKNHYGGNW